MAFTTIDKVDSGIITNMPTTKVTWAIGRNVRFKPNAVYKTPGKTLLATVTSVPPIRAMFTFLGYDDVYRTIVCCDTKIYSYTNNFGTIQDITPTAPPTSGVLDIWEFGLIGRMPILSNGKDRVWKWNDFNQTLSILANSPVVCRHIYIFNNRVIIANYQEGAYDYPSGIGWSAILKPENWTRDLKVLSGRRKLINPRTGLEADEKILRVSHIGEKLTIYTPSNVWYGVPAEHPRIYDFQIGVERIGLLSSRCMVNVYGTHYFMSDTDFYELGGSGLKAIGFNIRNQVFANLNNNALNANFAHYLPSTREVVFNVCTGTNTIPDTSYIYQLETQSWTICDCNYTCHAPYFDTTNTTWDSNPYTTWDSADDSRWDEQGTTGIINYEAVGNTNGQILKFDSGYNDNGVAINGYIESGDFTGSKLSKYGNDSTDVVIGEIWPMLKPQINHNSILVQLGTRGNTSQSIKWSNPQQYSIGTSKKVDFRGRNKYNRIRFYTDTLDTPWILEGYGMEFSLGGTR